MDCKHKNILVTGSAGFIGSHTAKALSQQGYNPVSLDNLEHGHRWAVKWGPLFEIDIENKNAVIEIIKEYKIDSVIHFAAYAYVGESVKKPQKYYYNNVSKTLTLLDAALNTGIKSFIFSSSCATYGLAKNIPIREKDLQVPINPYGESKLFIEKVLESYGKAYGLKSVVLRYFNAAGADLEGEIGEIHDPETHLIPLTIMAAINKSSTLSIFGNDYKTKDGTAIRDYVHVCDLADAHVKALQYLYSGNNSVSLNLGCGNGISVYEIVKKVEEVTGKKVPHKFVPRRIGDPPILVADSSKAKGILNWSPRFSNIENMIETSYNFLNSWYRSNE